MSKKVFRIFDIEISDYKKNRIKKTLSNALEKQNSKVLFAVTLNPEILLKAKEDKNYSKILNQADLKIIDGFGIKLIAFLRNKKVGDRTTGADLARQVVAEAKKNNLKVGFIIRKNGLSKEKDLRVKMDSLGIEEFTIKKIELTEVNSWRIRPNSEIKNVDLLLVGLGAPYQEKFIWQAKSQLPNLKLAMGVGGTFDFWTGKQRRAPMFMRKIGLEWLWRLFIQPNRLARTWKATVVFLCKNLLN